MESPRELDLQRDHGLTVVWGDGRRSFYSVAYLRRMSPSADMKGLREQIKTNPLTVLPPSAARASGALVVEDAELVGNYAIRLRFSDGHSTGIYSWEYLRSIEPDRPPS